MIFASCISITLLKINELRCCTVNIELEYKMNGKIILLLISVVAVGMFALPSTLALYTGSHAFVSGDNVDCDKCHTSGMDDITAELESGTAHQTLTCDDCHGTNNFNVDLSQGNSNGHAASMDVDCVGCHISSDYGYNHPYIENSNYATDCNPCHGPLQNGDVPPIDDILRQLNLATAAHHGVTFNATADNQGIDDRDQACIACHTDVPVNITDTSLNTVSGTIWIKGGSTIPWDSNNWTEEG